MLFSFFYSSFFLFGFYNVPYCNYRVRKNHSRTGKAHYTAYPFTHFGFITMHFAVRAECLCFHKRAFIASHYCIVAECLAFIAKPVLARMMPFSAIKCYHLRHHTLFTFSFIVYISFHISSFFRVQPNTQYRLYASWTVCAKQEQPSCLCSALRVNVVLPLH